MYSFLKNLLGIPPSEPPNRDENADLRNDFQNPNWGSHDNCDHEDDDIDPTQGGVHHGISGFHIFSDPIEMHKFLEKQMDEIFKQFGMFGLNSNGLDDERNLVSPYHQPDIDPNNSGSLRDQFLKQPGYVQPGVGQKEDLDLDGKINANDLKNFLDNREPKESTSTSDYYKWDGTLTIAPSVRMFSETVTVRTIKRPDGTYQTIKKVIDSSGNETITTTTGTVTESNPLPWGHQDDDDIAGTSIFKKFFP